MFNIGFSLLMILTCLTVGGMVESVPNFIAGYRVKTDWIRIKHVLYTSGIYVFILSLIGACLVFLTASYISINIFHDQRLVPVIKIVSIGIPLFNLSNLLLSYLRGLKAIMAMITCRNFIGDVGLFLSVFVISKINLTILNSFYSLFVKYVFIIIISSFLLWRYFLTSIYKKKSTKRIQISWGLILFSLPLTGALTLERIRLYMETILLGYFLSPQHVGWFSSALLLASLLLIIGACFRSILLPVVSEMSAEGNFNEILQVYRFIVKWISFILTPFVIFILFFPDLILLWCFGPAYQDAANALRILCIGYFVDSWAGNWPIVVYAFKKPKVDFYIKLIGVTTSFGLNLALIPFFGLQGAVISHVGSLLCMNIIGIIVIQYYLGGNILKTNLVKNLAISSSIFSLFLVIKNRLLTGIADFNMMVLVGLCILLCYAAMFKIAKLDKLDFHIINIIKRKHWIVIKNNEKSS